MNVKSINQSGGITAGIVNINGVRPDRILSESDFEFIKNKLPEDKNIEIIFGIPVNANLETLSFTRAIQSMISKIGWKVGSISKVGNFPIFEGDISFKKFSNAFEIYVANK